MPSRNEAIAAFYAAEARALEQAVAREVTAPPEMIEDACQYAWDQLLRRIDIEIGQGAFWWLHCVAVREAWRLSCTARRFVPVGDASRVAALGGRRSPSAAEIAAQRETLEALNRLLPRGRRAVLLSAAGFTYKEIARLTGETPRVVERQLRHARETLHAAGVPGLTRREREVLEGLAAGLPVTAIANRMRIQSLTVDGYVHSIYRKLGVGRRRDAIAALHGMS